MRLPARRGQTDDDFDSDAWDDATAAREDAQDADAPDVCSGCNGVRAVLEMVRPVMVRLCECGEVVYQDAGALRSGSDGNAAAGKA